MTEFRDGEGRRWTFRLTLGDVKRVMDELDVNLLNLSQYADSSEGSVTMRLINDDLFLGEIIAVVLAPQAKTYGVENVLDLFDGATTAAAQDAFLTEFAFFFKDRKNATAEAFALEVQRARASIGAGSAESQDVAD
jgi:hypothetical protein